MSEEPPIWEQPEEILQPPSTAGSRHRSHRSVPLAALVALGTGGVALGIVATLVIGQLTGGHSRPTKVVAAPVASRSTASSPSTVPSTTIRSSASSTKASSSVPVKLPPAAESGLAHAAPTSVVIPRIGVSSTLVDLGLAPDGTLQVPSDFAKAGWYSQGAYPGDANEPPAIIVGHVDNYHGPAVFFRLKELTAGDTVEVPRSDGSTATFVVYRTENYLKTSFPAQSVYAATGRPELRLITCTGSFDSNARSYLSNFVAYAYLESGSH